MNKKYIPQEKWNKKNGYMCKSYKLPIYIVEGLKSICTELGVSQSSVLINLISEFISENKKEKNN